MPTTASGIWSPEDGTKYDLPGITATMTSSIEDVIGPTVKDTGWVDVVPGSGFKIADGGWARYRRVGMAVFVSIRDVVPSASGAATMLTVPVTPGQELTMQFVNQVGRPVTHGTWIGANGQVRGTWVGGTQYRSTFSYPVAL